MKSIHPRIGITIIHLHKIPYAGNIIVKTGKKQVKHQKNEEIHSIRREKDISYTKRKIKTKRP